MQDQIRKDNINRALANSFELLCKFSKAENPDPASSLDFAFEELRETERAIVAEELTQTDLAFEEVVDGWIDLAFVALSGLRKSLVEKNINNPETVMAYALWRVCAANCAKLNQETGEFIKDEYGKIKKPEGWKAPTFADLLKK